MSAVFASLVPVFLVIATGWVARVTGFIGDKHWPGFERVTYVVFFPALVIDTLVRANLASVPVAGVGGALFGAVLLVSAAVIALRPVLVHRLGVDGPSFTSVFQGATRWNTFVAIAVAGGLHGPRGVALMAVAIAAMVPLLNVLAMAVFVRYAGGPRQTAWQSFGAFASNPFIWSCAVGLMLNPIGRFIPDTVLSYAEIIGRASLSAGLLVVGAGLDLRSLSRPRAVHLVTVGLKLFAMPIAAALLARAFGVEGPDLAVAVIAASVPTAAGAYVLARQLGGNAPLMAEILTLQTVTAMASMPVMLTMLAR